MARTNVEIDTRRLKRVMQRYGVHTKTEAIDLALRHLVGQPMTIKEVLDMHGAHAIADVPDDRGP